MKDVPDTEFLEQMADTVARAWATRSAATGARMEAATTRARAIATRLRAQHERARAKTLRDQRRSRAKEA